MPEHSQTVQFMTRRIVLLEWATPCATPVFASSWTRGRAEFASNKTPTASQPQRTSQGFFAEGDPQAGADPNDGNLWAIRSGQSFRSVHPVASS